jgi:hypothetical protein
MDGHVNHVFLPILLAIWVFALLCYVIVLAIDFSDVHVIYNRFHVPAPTHFLILFILH